MLTEMIPKYKYWQTNFPNLDTSKEGYPIPEFIGEKSNIEPVCIDTTTMQYQLAYREINAIDSIEADGIDLAEDEEIVSDVKKEIKKEKQNENICLSVVVGLHL